MFGMYVKCDHEQYYRPGPTWLKIHGPGMGLQAKKSNMRNIIYKTYMKINYKVMASHRVTLLLLIPPSPISLQSLLNHCISQKYRLINLLFCLLAFHAIWYDLSGSKVPLVFNDNKEICEVKTLWHKDTVTYATHKDTFS